MSGLSEGPQGGGGLVRALVEGPGDLVCRGCGGRGVGCGSGAAAVTGSLWHCWLFGTVSSMTGRDE